MKLSVVIQGLKGSGAVPASEAAVFLVKGLFLNGQEITAQQCLLDITPNSFLEFTIREASAVNSDWDLETLGDKLWKNEDDSLVGGPIEIEFVELKFVELKT